MDCKPVALTNAIGLRSEQKGLDSPEDLDLDKMLASLPFGVLLRIFGQLWRKDAISVALTCRALHHAGLLHVYEWPSIRGLEDWLSFCKGVAADARRAERARDVWITTRDSSFPPEDPTEAVSQAPVLPNVRYVRWSHDDLKAGWWFGEPPHRNGRVSSFLAIIAKLCPDVPHVRLELPSSSSDFGPLAVAPRLHTLEVDCHHHLVSLKPLLAACATLQKLELQLTDRVDDLDGLALACPKLRHLCIKGPKETLDFDPPQLDSLTLVSDARSELPVRFLRRRRFPVAGLYLTIILEPETAAGDLKRISHALKSAERWPSLAYLAINIGVERGDGFEHEPSDDSNSAEDDSDSDEPGDDSDGDGAADDSDDGGGDGGDYERLGWGYDKRLGWDYEKWGKWGPPLSLDKRATQRLEQLTAWAEQKGIQFGYTVDLYDLPIAAEDHFPMGRQDKVRTHVLVLARLTPSPVKATNVSLLPAHPCAKTPCLFARRDL